MSMVGCHRVDMDVVDAYMSLLFCSTCCTLVFPSICVLPVVTCFFASPMQGKKWARACWKKYFCLCLGSKITSLAELFSRQPPNSD